MHELLAWIEDHPGLASWLQLVGTLMALAIAIAVPILGRRDIEAAAILALRTPCRNASQAIRKSVAYFDGEPDTDARKTLFEEMSVAQEGLRSHPIDQLPPQMFEPVHTVMETIADFRRMLDRTQSHSEEIRKQARMKFIEGAVGFAALRKIRPRMFDDLGPIAELKGPSE